MSDLFGNAPPRTMKALSLWQPWATLSALGFKGPETRHWSTNYRGMLAIHAAKTLDMAGAPAALCHRALGQDWPAKCPKGAFVAVVRMLACRSTDDVFQDLTRAAQAAGNYTAGRFAFPLVEVRTIIEPIPGVGRQGFFNWEYPEDLEDRLGPVLDHEAICAAIGWGR